MSEPEGRGGAWTDERGAPATSGAWLSALLYLALIGFGLAQGVLGAFFYQVGPVPLAAIGFDLAIAATSLLGGWGTGRPAGAVAPVLGWIGAVFVLALGTPAGSVIITATAAGEAFLFGGALAAAAGAVAGMVIWNRYRIERARR